LGLVFSNSLMRALFKQLHFKRPGVYGPWRGAHLIPCGHHVFSCGHEIHGCVYDGLLTVDMFFSWLTSGKPSIFLCADQKVNLRWRLIGSFPYFKLLFLLKWLFFNVIFYLITSYPQLFHAHMSCG
jgi:hypothetical protein